MNVNFFTKQDGDTITDGAAGTERKPQVENSRVEISSLGSIITDIINRIDTG